MTLNWICFLASIIRVVDNGIQAIQKNQGWGSSSSLRMLVSIYIKLFLKITFLEI